MACGRWAGHNAPRRPGLHGPNGGVTPARAASTRGLTATDDDVFIPGMSHQITLDVLADSDHSQLARARVVQRVANKGRGDALSLIFGGNLGVHERDATVL